MNKVFQFAVGLIILVGLLIMFSGFYQILQPVTIKDVYQYIDHDARVVCYILKNGNGISCLPMSEVNLNE